jgi:iron complex outermembrane receptor protein
MHRLRLLGLLLVTLLLSSAPARADENPATGRLVGVLSDRTGAPVAGTVEVRGLETTLARSTPTDTSGRYAVDLLPAGRYRVIAAAAGMERAEREVAVAAAAETPADFSLELARRQDFVEVTARVAGPLAVVTDPRAPRQPMPAHDGADYLKTIPGFSVIRKGGTDGDPVLRGMAGSRLGVLLDGENVLGGCGNRMDPPTAYAFPAAFDRITVLKGPQTVAHGPGLSAGVVLFEREPLRFDAAGLRAYVAPTFGSFGRNDQVADLRAGARKGYLQVAATRSAASNFEDGRGEEVHSRYERWSANAALGWTPDADTRVELTGARSDGEAAYADRAMDGVRFSRDNLGLRIERARLSRTLETVEAQAYYNYVDHVMDNFSLRDFAPSMMMPNPTVANPDRRTIGARLQAALALSGSTRVTLGGDYQENRHSVRSSTNQPADPYESHARVSDARFESAGAFAELTQEIGARTRLVAGGRLDWWDGRDERQTVSVGMGMASARPNPTAGLERRETLPSAFLRFERELGAATTLYAGVGHAERAPDYWELVSKESADSLSAFLTRPEKTTQLDAGVVFRSGPVSGSAAFFLNEIGDFILIESGYAKPALAMPGGMSGGMGTSQRSATISRNVDASSYGAEATLAWEASRRLKLDATLAFVRGDNETDGLPLAQLPPFEARLAASWATERFSLGALARLVAAQERYALNQGNIVGQDLGPTAAFGVLSLNAAWRPSPHLSVSGGVDNLLDTTYAEFVSRAGAAVPGFTPTTRVNEPGRTLWVKADLRY